MTKKSTRRRHDAEFKARVALVFSGMIPSPASAIIMTFSTRAAFDAAVGPTTTEDFNSIPLGTTFATTPLDLGDFTMVRTVGNPNTARILSGGGSLFTTNFARTLTNFPPAQDILFTFDDPIAAFGLDTEAFNDGLIRTPVTASGENVPVTVLPLGQINFFGFSSTVPFTQVRFIGYVGDGFQFDNVSFAGASSPPGPSPVPEPATLTLFVFGLAGLGLAMRRRRST